MADHVITKFVTTTKMHKASCSCGARVTPQRTEQDVEDWWHQHMALVQRARAALGTKTPSLKSQQAYYAQKAADTTLDRKERALWQQLADELSSRLGAAPSETQDLLW